jgi:hypothetical protein
MHPPHAPANRRSPPHYAPTEPVPLPPQPPPPRPHTSVCVVVAAAAASSSRREPNTLFWRMHSQPNSHRAKHDDETGSSLGHTAPVWPAPTRERLLSRVGGHKGECPVGDLLNSPNRGRKDTVQNGSGLPFWAYFFFPAGPVPLYILQDGPASLGARKVLRPICGRAGIFPATTTGQTKNSGGGGGGCVPAAATTNVNNEQSGKRSQAQACGASGQGD